MVLLLSIAAYPLYSNNKYCAYAEVIKHHIQHSFLSYNLNSTYILYSYGYISLNMIGFIYIMSNPAYKGLIKIGQTSKDPIVRRKYLNTTGVPEPFVIEYQALVDDYRRQEKYIHQNLQKYRHKNDREFFKVSVPEAILAIQTQCDDKILWEHSFYATPEEIKEALKKKILIKTLKVLPVLIFILWFAYTVYNH